MRTSIIISTLFSASALAHPLLASIHQHLKRDWKLHKEYDQNNAHIKEYIWETKPTTTPAATPGIQNKVKAPSNGGNDRGNNGQQASQPTSSVTPILPASSAQSTPPPQQTSNPSNGSGTSGGNGSCSKASVSGGPAEDWFNDPCSGGKHVLESMNAMRAKWLPSLKDSPLKWNNTLVTHAYKTATDKNGEDGATVMRHEIVGYSWQVIALGNGDKGSDGLTPFESAVMIWLCEIPQGSIGCTSGGDGTTGHANILKDTNHHNIGCYYMDSANDKDDGGLWTCNVS